MRTFGNIGTYVSVGTFYPYPYSRAHFTDFFVSQKRNQKKFGRGIIKAITDIRISVMFDDCRLKVLDKQTVLQGRLLLNEKDSKAERKN